MIASALANLELGRDSTPCGAASRDDIIFATGRSDYPEPDDQQRRAARLYIFRGALRHMARQGDQRGEEAGRLPAAIADLLRSSSPRRGERRQKVETNHPFDASQHILPKVPDPAADLCILVLAVLLSTLGVSLHRSPTGGLRQPLRR